MKLLIIAMLILITSCTQKVTGQQIEGAYLLCQDSHGVEYVIADGETVAVYAECKNGERVSAYLSDLQ